MVLPSTLLWDHDSLPLSLLVDSGADDCFIDETLAKHAYILVEVLSELRTILDLNGKPITHVTHWTKPLTLVISGNHREVIHLFLIPSSAAPAVLGSPWLAHHNPQLEWSTGSISGWSVACHSHWLRSAYGMLINWCTSMRVMSGRQPSTLCWGTSNIWSCLLGSPMPQLSSRSW